MAHGPAGCKNGRRSPIPDREPVHDLVTAGLPWLESCRVMRRQVVVQVLSLGDTVALGHRIAQNSAFTEALDRSLLNATYREAQAAQLPERTSVRANRSSSDPRPLLHRQTNARLDSRFWLQVDECSGVTAQPLRRSK